jgi:hypothetical protein
MNQRIKQLAVDAGLYVDLAGEPYPKWLGAEACELAYADFGKRVIEDSIQTLVNMGYTDAAQCLQDIHFGVSAP